jgi:hypothetical protein
MGGRLEYQRYPLIVAKVPSSVGVVIATARTGSFAEW